MVLWLNPVSVLRVVTLASGTAALLESVTVPLRLVPVYCADKGAASHTTAAAQREITLFLMKIPLPVFQSVRRTGRPAGPLPPELLPACPLGIGAFGLGREPRQQLPFARLAAAHFRRRAASLRALLHPVHGEVSACVV